MSLLRTLATVAVGVAAARGANYVMGGRNRGDDVAGGDGLLDALDAQDNDGGLGGLLGGDGRSGGGLGDMLESLGGGGVRSGLGGLLGPAAGGAIGGLVGNMVGGRDSAPGFGRRLNEALRTGREPSSHPTEDEEAMAGLLIRAMIMAAKSDGRIDRAEREQLLSRLGDLSRAERRFVEDTLEEEIDLRDFARDVPRDRGLRRQIYAAAMAAIDVDNRAERNFMEDLADALDIDGGDRGTVQKTMSKRYTAEPRYADWRQAKMDRARHAPGPGAGGGYFKTMPRKG